MTVRLCLWATISFFLAAAIAPGPLSEAKAQDQQLSTDWRANRAANTPYAPGVGTSENELFVHGDLSGGAVYLRASGALAYGSPEHWLGIEFRPSLRSDNFQGWLGLHYSNHLVDLQIGVRGAYSLRRGLQPKKSNYKALEANTGTTPNSRHLTSEVALRLRQRIDRFAINGLFSLHYVDDFSAEFNVVEENLRIVLDGPLAVRAGVAISSEWFLPRRFLLDLRLEYLRAFRRQANTVRLGGTILFQISDAWSAFGMIMYPLYSPDQLGLGGGTLRFGALFRFSSHSDFGHEDPS